MPDVEDIVCAVCLETEVRCYCCPRCGRTSSSCECCSACEQLADECTCAMCDGCEELFDPDYADSCCSDYCSYRCANRHDHHHCAGCSEAIGSYEMMCSECGHGGCCVSWCDTNACTHCTECCACESSCIESYSSRNYPAARPAGLPASACGLGVEVEVECGDDNRGSVAQDIHDKFSEQILLKEDGSLHNGFEMVTGRYSLDEQQQLWPKLARCAVAAGARSWEHQTTGLHVHVSRKAFTPLSLSKFVLFFNAPKTQQQLERLAGRSSSEYAQVSSKKIGTARNDTNRRYQAVNLCNARTVEVRIFKGTLHPLHILADIELCHAVWAFTLNCSIDEAESWPAFWEFVLRNKKPYARLIEFFNRKGY